MEVSMKKVLRSLFLGIAIASIVVSGLANTTPQTLPFTQNWSNIGLITVTDDWAGVPGIVGYRGDDLSIVIGADLQTILANGNATPVDVNANQTNPSTFTTGGISEFEITNPAVGMQGSGTSDVPHLVIHLNTTGNSGIQFSCNVRDLDANADDSLQQVNVQYRVGGTGDYINVPGGYIADATTVGTDTQVTALNLALPAAVNNQALVEIRVVTINAIGSDEHVGIDDISVTAGPAAAPVQRRIDFNGDGKTDWAITRNLGGSPNQKRWYYSLNGVTGSAVGSDWGLSTDVTTPADFDGDGKTDITVWRGSNVVNQSAFYILASATNTFRFERFGEASRFDSPTIVGDYDGDGKADPAVFATGTLATSQSFFYYRGSLNNPTGNITYIPWGPGQTIAYPGDFDGDGKFDFCVRNLPVSTTGPTTYSLLKSNGFTQEYIVWGFSADSLIPGDYDGDGKTDFAVTRSNAGNKTWHILTRTGAISQFNWGIPADAEAVGDYDGDGKSDIGVWRAGIFYIRQSTNGALLGFQWGATGDAVVANFDEQ
jgi:FG-GAP repeat